MLKSQAIDYDKELPIIVVSTRGSHMTRRVEIDMIKTEQSAEDLNKIVSDMTKDRF
jgi:hypothetical protein